MDAVAAAATAHFSRPFSEPKKNFVSVSLCVGLLLGDPGSYYYYYYYYPCTGVICLDYY
jgi:hypothetical protein